MFRFWKRGCNGEGLESRVRLRVRPSPALPRKHVGVNDVAFRLTGFGGESSFSRLFSHKLTIHQFELVHGADTRVESTKTELRDNQRFVGWLLTIHSKSKSEWRKFLEKSQDEEETDWFVWKIRKILTRPEGSTRSQLQALCEC